MIASRNSTRMTTLRPRSLQMRCHQRVLGELENWRIGEFNHQLTNSPTYSVPFENRFWHLDVDAERLVDELRDRDVAGDAGQLIGLVLAHAFGGRDEIDHFLNRGF